MDDDRRHPERSPHTDAFVSVFAQHFPSQDVRVVVQKDHTEVSLAHAEGTDRLLIGAWRDGCELALHVPSELGAFQQRIHFTHVGKVLPFLRTLVRYQAMYVEEGTIRG